LEQQLETNGQNGKVLSFPNTIYPAHATEYIRGRTNYWKRVILKEEGIDTPKEVRKIGPSGCEYSSSGICVYDPNPLPTNERDW